MNQVKDFSGNTVYIGIDVHLKQWNSSVYFEDRLFKTFQQKPDAEELFKFLNRHFPGAEYKSAYEAGFSGFTAHRQLEQLGVKNLVINASDIPRTDKDNRRKNDKRDAKRIGKSLVNNQLEGIYIPTIQTEADRKLVRSRTVNMRRDLLVAKQRMKSFLMIKGIKYFESFPKSSWSKEFVNWIENLEFTTASDRWMRDSMLRRLEHLQDEQGKLDREIVRLSQTPRYSKLVNLLRSAPGIGLLTAMVLITELIDMKRFSSLDKLCSYAGLVPDVSASDQTQKVKGITRRANPELRRLLIQASWVAAGKDPVLAKAYHGYKKSMPTQKAIVKVARKLLAGIRAVWLQKQYWKN